MVFLLSGLFLLSDLVGGRRPPTDFSKWFRIAAGHVEGAEGRAKEDFGLLDY